MDFKGAEGKELHIGDNIRGLNSRREFVQGMLSSFDPDGFVLLADGPGQIHSLLFKEVYVGHLKDFTVVVCEREDWDNPTIRVIKALDEEMVMVLLGTSMEMDPDELEQGEEDGEISIIIHESKDIMIDVA
jgi:hypothetical protein